MPQKKRAKPPVGKKYVENVGKKKIYHSFML